MSPQPGCYPQSLSTTVTVPAGRRRVPRARAPMVATRYPAGRRSSCPRLPSLPAASRSLHPGQETPMLSPAVRFPCLLSHQIPAGHQDMSASALLAWVIAASVF
jgi:hypothetical protein